MEARVDQQVIETVFKFGFPRPRLESTAQAARAARSAPGAAPVAQGSGAARPGLGAGAAGVAGDAAAKVGRNDPCPCGSGKKYKRCHGA
jgi:preprotein translocase subunit SecA